MNPLPNESPLTSARLRSALCLSCPHARAGRGVRNAGRRSAGNGSGARAQGGGPHVRHLRSAEQHPQPQLIDHARALAPTVVTDAARRLVSMLAASR